MGKLVKQGLTMYFPIIIDIDMYRTRLVLVLYETRIRHITPTLADFRTQYSSSIDSTNRLQCA